MFARGAALLLTASLFNNSGQTGFPSGPFYASQNDTRGTVTPKPAVAQISSGAAIRPH